MWQGTGMLEGPRVLNVPVSGATAGASGLSGHFFRRVRARLPRGTGQPRVPGAARGGRSAGSSAGRDTERGKGVLGAGGVRQAGAGARPKAPMSPAAVLVGGEGASVGDSILYVSMGAPERPKPLGVGAFGPERGEAPGRLDAARSGLETLAGALNAMA